MLSKENILNTLGLGAEERIYQEYTNINPRPGLYTTNPFEPSNKKTFKFFVNSVNRLAFKDFSPNRDSYVGDCFTAVMFATGKDFVDSLKDIDARFKLGLSADKDYIPAPKSTKPYKPYEAKEYAEIEVYNQPLKNYDKEYLNKYNIYWQIAEAYGVNSCAYAKLNGNAWLTSCKHMPLFSYMFSDGSKKVYSPYNAMKKWIGNANKNVIANADILPAKIDKLIIDSSVKDGLVSATHGYHQISFMSETVIPDNLEEILDRCDEVYAWFDCDDAGKTATKKLCMKYPKIKPIYWESDMKDKSDFSFKYGFSKTKKLLQDYVGKPSFKWTLK